MRRFDAKKLARRSYFSNFILDTLTVNMLN